MHTIKTIVTRKRIVEHHEVGADEVLRTEVLPEDFPEKLDRLAADQFAKVVDPFIAAKRGVHLGVHLDAIHGVDVQPLLHKRVDEPVCPLVGHHPNHLRRKGCPVEKCTTVSQRTKFIVRHGIPEKIREARRQLMSGKRPRFTSCRLEKIQEIRRDQRHHQRLPKGAFQIGKLRTQFPVKAGVSTHLLAAHRPPPCAREKRLEHLADIGLLPCLAQVRWKQDSPMFLRRPLVKKRPLKLQPLHVQPRIVLAMHPDFFLFTILASDLPLLRFSGLRKLIVGVG